MLTVMAKENTSKKDKQKAIDGAPTGGDGALNEVHDSQLTTLDTFTWDRDNLIVTNGALIKTNQFFCNTLFYRLLQ